MTKQTQETVGPGKFVAYAYKVYDTDNNLLFEAPDDAPDTLIYGVSDDVVPGLVAAMKDLKAGDKFEVTLPPEAAFGPVYDENIVDLDKELFMRDGKLAEEVSVGAVLPMMTDTGLRINGKVLEVGDKVKMDFNHPFAGKTVRYDGRIIDVRDATEDELRPRHSCGGCGGCGGGACSDGNCGGDGCSDGNCGCN